MNLRKSLAIVLVIVGLGNLASAVLQGSLTSAFLSVGLLAFAWVAASERGRVLAFNLGALSLVAYIAFGQLIDSREHVQTFSDSANVFVPNPILGHRPAANLHTSAKMTVDGHLVYDVNYTTNDDALRISPPESLGASRDCVLFFGCSFMFGEGVADDETLPWNVGVLAGGRFRVRNFGYSAYGPHQMLAAIESGLVANAARCDPKLAIYQSHPHHILRVAGKWSSDRHGPAYALDAAGAVERVGSFADQAGSNSWASGLRDLLPDGTRFLDNTVPDEADIRLFHAVVRRSRDLLQQSFPGIEFHVLHWDINAPYAEQLFHQGWDTGGIEVHRLSRVLPYAEPGWENSVLLPHDVHPTAATHAKIAAYTASEVLHLDVPHAGVAP